MDEDVVGEKDKDKDKEEEEKEKKKEKKKKVVRKRRRRKKKNKDKDKEEDATTAAAAAAASSSVKLLEYPQASTPIAPFLEGFADPLPSVPEMRVLPDPYAEAARPLPQYTRRM